MKQKHVVLVVVFILIFAIPANAAFLVPSMPHLAQLVAYFQEFALELLAQSIASMSRADFGLSQWSMAGVGSVLVFFRLRRKHQATFTATRLGNFSPLLDSQLAMSMASVPALRSGYGYLSYSTITMDVDATDGKTTEATANA